MSEIKIPRNIFSKKVRDYTFTTLFFLIFSIFIMFAIRPSLISIFSLKKEEEDLKKINSLYNEKILIVTEVQSQIEKNRDYLPLLNEAVSTYPQVNKLIEDIKNEAERNTFLIKKTTISDVDLSTVGKKNLEVVEVIIEGESAFDDLLKLTQGLFNQRRLKTIKKVVIASNPESTTSSQLKITLNVEGYYL